jgi:hypothetical protein
MSVAGMVGGGVAVGGSADPSGTSVVFQAEVSAYSFRGYRPVLGVGYAARDYGPDKVLIGDWDTAVGKAGVATLIAGCEYPLLAREWYGFSALGGFVWAWERAKLWDVEGLSYKTWAGSAPGVYVGAGAELREEGFAVGLSPRLTVLFDKLPRIYSPASETVTAYADGPSQFVDVLFRLKYSF